MISKYGPGDNPKFPTHLTNIGIILPVEDDLYTCFIHYYEILMVMQHHSNLLKVFLDELKNRRLDDGCFANQDALTDISKNIVAELVSSLQNSIAQLAKNPLNNKYFLEEFKRSDSFERFRERCELNYDHIPDIV